MNFFVRFKRIFVSVCVLGVLIPAAIAYAATYTVVPSDSLSAISQKLNVSVEQIKTANGLTGDFLEIGQILTIPDHPAAGSAAPANTTYTVKPGDSLHVIAQKYNIRPEALILTNSLTGNLIYPGQQLIVPVATSRSAGPVAVEVSRSAKRPVIPYTEEELDLLARLVTAEAGGEPVEAQVGVAAVVINRVQSSSFPNTISEVIYARNQFGPVQNGWIKRPATSTALEATEKALYGEDPTNGALYFFDTSTKNSYLRSLPVLANYGHMIYANTK
ncbi:LysM peptidoglycan-binding domain-containing protein [Desulforamulus ruminis]|uniref:Cell wall hydrolase SleB n=1 Tax=Desulforamulus ruminis (strain ATCC 23193 / DSM 2154 / NCIMB 8452 / DL) TaxID=696281 RepID=F6DV50_DESRL|nr:LysM peptidoglycan-binding domain-containing protein [Desulforamulus ruminis]AEG59116.1 cell wall hydrolase SleB [Desulforamulus ruminis DSM 2154]